MTLQTILLVILTACLVIALSVYSSILRARYLRTLHNLEQAEHRAHAAEDRLSRFTLALKARFARHQAAMSFRQLSKPTKLLIADIQGVIQIFAAAPHGAQ